MFDVSRRVGLGGLGHLAVKLAAAWGAEVAVFTTSPHQADDARALGTSHVLASTDADQMASARDRFDLVMDTISSSHDLEPYLRTVALDGALCLLGHLGPASIDPITLLLGRKSLTSAGSGGRQYTQELLDFCAEHGIVADVEVLSSAGVSTALDRLERNDVRYRVVLDPSDLEPGGPPG